MCQFALVLRKNLISSWCLKNCFSFLFTVETFFVLNKRFVGWQLSWKMDKLPKEILFVTRFFEDLSESSMTFLRNEMLKILWWIFGDFWGLWELLEIELHLQLMSFKIDILECYPLCLVGLFGELRSSINDDNVSRVEDSLWRLLS